MPNLQCQRGIPDHNYLLEPRGPENFWGLPCVRTHLAPVSTTANTFCLFLGSQGTVSIIICNNPHLEANLDWNLYQGHGKCPAQISLWSLWWSMQGIRDGEGLNCFSGFKILHKWTSVVGCPSIMSGGVMSIRKSNHICFWVTGPSIAIEIGFGFLSVLSFLDLPHSLYSLLEFVSFLLISNGLPNIINVSSHDGAQHEYQCPMCWGRLDYLGFHSCSWMWPNQGPQRQGHR